MPTAGAAQQVSRNSIQVEGIRPSTNVKTGPHVKFELLQANSGRSGGADEQSENSVAGPVSDMPASLWLLMIFSLASALFQSAIIFGWAPMAVLLANEGLFSGMCSQPFSGTEAPMEPPPPVDEHGGEVVQLGLHFTQLDVSQHALQHGQRTGNSSNNATVDNSAPGSPSSCTTSTAAITQIFSVASTLFGGTHSQRPALHVPCTHKGICTVCPMHSQRPALHVDDALTTACLHVDDARMLMC